MGSLLHCLPRNDAREMANRKTQDLASRHRCRCGRAGGLPPIPVVHPHRAQAVAFTDPPLCGSESLPTQRTWKNSKIMSKSTPLPQQPVLEAIATLKQVETDLQRAEELQQQNAERFARLRDEGDLLNDEVVQEIIRRHTFVEIWPSRITAIRGKLQQAGRALDAATKKVMAEAVNLRIQAGWISAQADARKRLEPLKLDPGALEVAIAGSASVQAWKRLVSTAGWLAPENDDFLAYAEAALTLFKQVGELEAEATSAA